MVSCVKEHNIVWNYLWFSIIANGEKDKKKKKKRRKKWQFKKAHFKCKIFHFASLDCSATSIIIVINIIIVIIAIIRPCKSGFTQKRHHVPLFLRAFVIQHLKHTHTHTHKTQTKKQTKNRKISFNKYLENVFLNWLNCF